MLRALQGGLDLVFGIFFFRRAYEARQIDTHCMEWQYTDCMNICSGEKYELSGFYCGN